MLWRVFSVLLDGSVTAGINRAVGRRGCDTHAMMSISGRWVRVWLGGLGFVPGRRCRRCFPTS